LNKSALAPLQKEDEIITKKSRSMMIVSFHNVFVISCVVLCWIEIEM